MVMNRSAFAALSESAKRTTFVAHDWWSYILVSGIGGMLRYDPIPHIAYRQHGSNLIGHNMGLQAKARRVQLILKKQFARWNSVNLAALILCDDLLLDESRMIVREFTRIRHLSFPENLSALRRLGVYRQTQQGDMALLFAAAIGHI